jgi:hypothetical protein
VIRKSGNRFPEKITRQESVLGALIQIQNDRIRL